MIHEDKYHILKFIQNSILIFKIYLLITILNIILILILTTLHFTISLSLNHIYSLLFFLGMNFFSLFIYFAIYYYVHDIKPNPVSKNYISEVFSNVTYRYYIFIAIEVTLIIIYSITFSILIVEISFIDYYVLITGVILVCLISLLNIIYLILMLKSSQNISQTLLQVSIESGEIENI